MKVPHTHDEEDDNYAKEVLMEQYFNGWGGLTEEASGRGHRGATEEASGTPLRSS